VVPKEGAGSYHLGASNPLEDAAYVVGGYAYNMEVRSGPTGEPLGRVAGNTSADMAWDTKIGALAIDPSPTGMAGHCCYCSDDW